MFGYITTNHMELKIKDYVTYQACYCGLCQRLKKNHGQRARLVLSFDMTFVEILLNGLYDTEKTTTMIRCPFHPLKKKQVITSAMSDYAADMNLLLAYYNWEDDWIDDRSLKLAECEKKGDQDNLDEAANLTGEMLGEILVPKEDEWSDVLRRMGFYLGKFIYYMDAYDDLEEDKKNGTYNPLLSVSQEVIEEILKMMMANVSECFEYLPIIEYEEILRNILYSGVWLKYNTIKKERQQEE